MTGGLPRPGRSRYMYSDALLPAICLAGRYSWPMQHFTPPRESAYARALELQDAGAEIADVGPWLLRAKRELQDLVDRAVAEAAYGSRQRSWTEIGRSLGVSRQAVQQKYDR